MPVAEFSIWLRRVLWGRILRGRHHGTRLCNSVDVKWLANSPVQWPSWTWCRTWWNHSWHSSRVTLNQCCFVFIRPRTPLVYGYHVISRTQSHSAVFGAAPTARRCVTIEQLLYCSDWIWTGRAAQIDAKTKFRFGNIVPKQWTFLGFVQDTSANLMYIDDNKISQQQKVLHMNKMLERVTHFQTSFRVEIQALFQRRNHCGSTHCVHHYPSINCIFSAFSTKNREHESTLTTSKNSDGTYQYKRKLKQ